MTRTDTRDRIVPTWGLAGAGVALLTVALEVLGSVFGDAIDTRYPGWLVPLGWPLVLRVLLWLGATAGVAAYHLALRRADGRSRWLMGSLTTGLFALFTVGVTTGQEWASFH